jgi:hypothetical protein
VCRNIGGGRAAKRQRRSLRERKRVGGGVRLTPEASRR